MGKINPLLKEAYEMNKNLDGEGIYTWHTFAHNTFEEMGLDIKDFESSDKPFNEIKFDLKIKLKNQINNVYKGKTVNKLSSIDDSSKLSLYNKLKSEIGIEKYLLEEPSFKNRQMITKLRVWKLKQVDIKISQGKTEIVNFAKMKLMMNTIFYLIVS